MESLFVAIEDAVVGIGESLRGDIQGDKDGAIVLLENILQRLYHFNTIFILNSNYLQTHNPVWWRASFSMMTFLTLMLTAL